jgi:hypothetical protein
MDMCDLAFTPIARLGFGMLCAKMKFGDDDDDDDDDDELSDDIVYSTRRRRRRRGKTDSRSCPLST